MKIKCAVLSAIGALGILGALIGILWLIIISNIVAIIFVSLCGLMLVCLSFAILYDRCVEHHKKKERYKETENGK